MSPETSYANTEIGFDTELYDEKVKAAYDAIAAEEGAEKTKIQPRNGRAIKKLIELVFKRGEKNNTTETVYATKDNIKTKVTRHAKAEAFDDEITLKPYKHTKILLQVDVLLYGRWSLIDWFYGN